jgi:hypothetical protein
MAQLTIEWHLLIVAHTMNNRGHYMHWGAAGLRNASLKKIKK